MSTPATYGSLLQDREQADRSRECRPDCESVRPRHGGLFLHEWAILILGVLTVIALAWRDGITRSATCEAAIATFVLLLTLFAWRGSGAFCIRGRTLIACGYVLWFYFAVERIVPALGVPLCDARLLDIDRFLFGETPAVLLQEYANPWLTEAMSAGYLSYHFYITIALVTAYLGPVRHLVRLAAPLGLAFAIGFAGYLVMPAVGPIRMLPSETWVPVEGYLITGANDALVAHGSSVFDVFPSLHVLMTCMLLAHDWRWNRLRFCIMLFPSLLLFVSTMYLRYHYAIDVIAGFGLFAVLSIGMPRLLQGETSGDEKDSD